ncbi:putative SP-containing protein [Vairimorpha necatrix]|uniref:SP-containing protein n=1 Tax=Vairimorpha necatrix TaxID=6039 RepID=A0AAX4JEL9_9MICR
MAGNKKLVFGLLGLAAIGAGVYGAFHFGFFNFNGKPSLSTKEFGKTNVSELYAEYKKLNETDTALKEETFGNLVKSFWYVSKLDKNGFIKLFGAKEETTATKEAAPATVETTKETTEAKEAKEKPAKSEKNEEISDKGEQAMKKNEDFIKNFFESKDKSKSYFKEGALFSKFTEKEGKLVVNESELQKLKSEFNEGMEILHSDKHADELIQKDLKELLTKKQFGDKKEYTLIDVAANEWIKMITAQ